MSVFLISLASVIVWSGYVHCQERRPVVLDVDPGIDDALAVLTVLNDPSVSVVGITCVRGNADVHTVIVNLYKILYVTCRMEIPVYSGQNYGLITSPASDNYFGKDGFGDLGDELKYDIRYVSKVRKESAAIFLARTVRQNPGKITILALGPLTNIALALELYPDFIKQARQVIVLGGTIRGSGNVGPSLEFNFYLDPYAAAVVLDRAESSGTTVTLVPMETVVGCDLGAKWRWTRLAKFNTTAISFLNKLEEDLIKMHPSAAAHYTPYDVYAVVALVNPQSINSTQKIYGLVETSGDHTRGVLLLDYNDSLKKRPNLEVILSMKQNEIRKTIMSSLSIYKPCINPRT